MARLYRQAKADRWNLSVALFAVCLESSARRAFAGRRMESNEVERYVESLHLEELALTAACGDGDERAWEHFVLEYRPVLYRAADALDPRGGARELADSLYADLFGLQEQDGERRSLLRYFHGRSSLGTWLRAVLAQRFIDRHRAARRIEPLDEALPRVAAPQGSIDPDRGRYLTLLEVALRRALERLAPRDRLRIGCYYAQQLTLAETGRLIGEHEATVSRHLARTRRVIREEVERELRANAGFDENEITACFESVLEDTSTFDITEMLEGLNKRKNAISDRST